MVLNMSKLKFSIIIDMPEGVESTLVREYIEDTLYGSWWQFEGQELWDSPSVKVVQDEL